MNDRARNRIEDINITDNEQEEADSNVYVRIEETGLQLKRIA